MEFKEGDKVIVKDLYNLRTDGICIFKGMENFGRQKGYYKVELDTGVILVVASERVKKDE